MKTFVRMVVLCLLVPAGGALAQDKAGQEKPGVAAENPLTSWNKVAYARLKGLLARSAEKMPEENYGFKPVDTVRSYGQIVGHLADAQYEFCSMALGEKSPGWTSSTLKPPRPILLRRSILRSLIAIRLTAA